MFSPLGFLLFVSSKRDGQAEQELVLPGARQLLQQRCRLTPAVEVIDDVAGSDGNGPAGSDGGGSGGWFELSIGGRVDVWAAPA
jgi:hypothetical protein